MSLSLIDTIKIFINTVVRIIPLGLYAGSSMSGVVFQDFRGILLFCGFLGNELINVTNFLFSTYISKCNL